MWKDCKRSSPGDENISKIMFLFFPSENSHRPKEWARGLGELRKVTKIHIQNSISFKNKPITWKFWNSSPGLCALVHKHTHTEYPHLKMESKMYPSMVYNFVSIWLTFGFYFPDPAQSTMYFWFKSQHSRLMSIDNNNSWVLTIQKLSCQQPLEEFPSLELLLT